MSVGQESKGGVCQAARRAAFTRLATLTADMRLGTRRRSSVSTLALPLLSSQASEAAVNSPAQGVDRGRVHE